MKQWIIWLIVVAFIVVMGAFALFFALWNNFSSEWTIEQHAAQYALNHSPINHIDGHSVFTGPGVEEVFDGVDTFGAKWVVFVYGNPLTTHAVSAKGLLSKSQMQKMAVQQFHLKSPQLSLGYLPASERSVLKTNARVVWEVYGQRGAMSLYAYFDAYTGKLIDQPFSLNPHQSPVF